MNHSPFAAWQRSVSLDAAQPSVRWCSLEDRELRAEVAGVTKDYYEVSSEAWQRRRGVLTDNYVVVAGYDLGNCHVDLAGLEREVVGKRPLCEDAKGRKCHE